MVAEFGEFDPLAVRQTLVAYGASDAVLREFAANTVEELGEAMLRKHHGSLL